MKVDPRAGQPALSGDLVDVPRLIAAYDEERPDPGITEQRVVFGTSGHRGSSFEENFHEWHIRAITEAICLYRRTHNLDGPLFLGIDTILTYNQNRTAGFADGIVYSVCCPPKRPAADCTARLIPTHPGESVPLESGQILGQQ